MNNFRLWVGAWMWLVYSGEVTAQVLIPEKTIAIARPVAVSINRYEDLVVCDENGSVTLFAPDGTARHQYSPQKLARVSLIEAWKSVKIFLFHKDLQEYTLLDRFLTPSPVYRLSSISENGNTLGYIRVATLSADDNLWLYDDSDLGLKRYDFQSGQISIHTPLNLVLSGQDYSINFMREYQNLLFLNNLNREVLVFDNLGNYQKKLAFGTDYFSFAGDELYFLQKDRVHFFHLYTAAERDLMLPPGLAPIRFALVLKGRVALFTDRELLLFTSK